MTAAIIKPPLGAGEPAMNDLLMVPVANDLTVHPLADIFPMLSDDELADLAADIKANGLRVPIVLDATGRILIDGRNRLAACKIAGVEPYFERLSPDADPLAVIVSLNVKRRNLTASQRAIAAAEAWIIAEEEGRVQEGAGRPKSGQNNHIITKPRKTFSALFGAGQSYIRLARVLWADDPQAALAVRRGVEDLQTAHRELMQRIGRFKAHDNRLRDLERERPDLAEKVKGGELDIDAAERQAKADDDDLKQQRWAITVNLIDAINVTDRDPEMAEDIARLFDPVVEAGKGSPKITVERLQRASDYLNALADLWGAADAYAK